MQVTSVCDCRTVRPGEIVRFTHIKINEKMTMIATLINSQGQEVPIKPEDIPYELRQIASPIQFRDFVKDAYAVTPQKFNGDYGLQVFHRNRGGADGDSVVDASDEADLPSKTMALVRPGLKELANRRIEKNVVLLVGITGAGKSTLGNLLNEVPVLGVQKGLEFVFDIKNPIFAISHSNVESCTTCPGTHCPKDKDHTYIDYPGFDDLHGAAQDICNAFFRKEVLKNVEKIKIVLVVPFRDVSKRGPLFSQTIHDFVQFLGVESVLSTAKSEAQKAEIFDSITNSIVLVVSQVPALENSKVRDEIEKYMEEYLTDASGLSNIGKDILRRILENESWDVFSVPNQVGAGIKTQSEKMKILNLIKKSKYISKTDTDVQVKVSPKYSGKVQTSLQYLISHLKKQFADRIFDEVTEFLKSFFTSVLEEDAIAKFQKRYQEIVNSTEPCSLCELLKNLRFTAGMFENGLLVEAQDQDESIKFLRDLLPKQQAELIPHHRDWLKEFGLRDRLVVWNKILLQMTSPAVLTVEGDKMRLQGYFPKTSQISRVLGTYSNIKEIEIHALYAVTIDENLSGPQLRGANVTIIAPKWIVRNDRRIELVGKDCDFSYANRNTDGSTDGASGTDGEPGLPGKNGGQFLGLGVVFSDVQHLTVVTNGGKGGSGQNGGNGYLGADGPFGAEKRDFCKTAAGAKDLGTVITMGWDYVQHPPHHHHDNKYDIKLLMRGKDGQVGGNAGKGGAGGNGGRSGNITFVSLHDDKIQIQTQSNTGALGTDGAAGVAGLGGKKGKDWTGTWALGHAPEPEGQWNKHNLPHHEGGGERAASGTVPADKKTAGRADSEALERFDVVDHLYRYREFVIRESNPLVMQSVEIFRRVYDTNKEIGANVSIDSFIAECDKMEEFFARMEDKTKCLPMYLWMIERIQTFEVTATSAQLADLQCLYTLSLSKVLQIRAAQDSRLIIDIKGYLDVVRQNIDELVRLDHNVMVGVYEREYVDEINGKIAEADVYIQKLSDDIRAADKEIDLLIKKLQAEIEELQKKGEEKRSEIDAKRKKLREIIEKKKTFGLIATIVQCVGSCIYPPIGAIVAGAIGAGLTIAANAEAAPTLAAEALTSYAEGLTSTLTDKASGKPYSFNSVHLNALSRVRTLTLANAVINAIGSNSSEDEQLKAMDKAIKDIDDQRKQLDQYKDKVQTDFKTNLHQVVDGAVDMQKALKDKSKIALDFSRLGVKRAFDNIKIQVGAFTKAFAVGDEFVNIMRQLEEAIDTSAKIYDHIQDYEEKRRLVRYLARLAAPGVQNPRIEAYQQKVKRNVVLEQYSRAVAAVRQWAFPYASMFLGDFVNLRQFVEAATIDDFMVQVKRQLTLLTTKVGTEDAEVSSARDTFLWSGRFAASVPNGPFYKWNYAEHGREIRDLFRGESVILFADVDRTSIRTSAVKFSHVELQITSKKPRVKRMLSEALQGVQVEMHHSGLSYYRFDDKTYQMSNDKGFCLQYRFKDQGETPEDVNHVFKKMKKGNLMLSPYTQWIFKLDVAHDFVEKFGDELSSVEILLIGEGQYVQTTKAKGKNWELGQYSSNVFIGVGGAASVSGSGLSRPSTGPTVSSANDNAFKQKDNGSYLYQGTDVGFIVRSPTITAELKNFHFIQGLQLDHLRGKVDEIVELVNAGKTILCVYNISDRHWVTFCMLKQASGKLLTLYKDSFGANNTDLVELLKTKSADFQFHPMSEQTGDGTSCGILALENMRIMARGLDANKDTFIANFASQAFCTLERARQLRQGEFATLYTQGVEESERLETLQAIKALELSEAHKKEIGEILARLQEVIAQGEGSNDIKVIDKEAPAGSVRTIAVQVGANSTTLDSYHYRIQKTKDIPMRELQRILMSSHFAWHEGSDYRIEGSVVKVSKLIG